jgi:hypothetical protein
VVPIEDQTFEEEVDLMEDDNEVENQPLVNHEQPQEGSLAEASGSNEGERQLVQIEENLWGRVGPPTPEQLSNHLSGKRQRKLYTLVETRGTCAEGRMLITP